jgi:hypothetical protein
MSIKKLNSITNLSDEIRIMNKNKSATELTTQSNESSSVDSDDKNDGKKGKYPKHVFLIILNEFCERFSYYGMRTILYIFFTNFIELEPNTATAIYHAFVMLCYFTPILGAILAVIITLYFVN